MTPHTPLTAQTVLFLCHSSGSGWRFQDLHSISIMDGVSGDNTDWEEGDYIYSFSFVCINDTPFARR